MNRIYCSVDRQFFSVDSTYFLYFDFLSTACLTLTLTFGTFLTVGGRYMMMKMKKNAQMEEEKERRRRGRGGGGEGGAFSFSFSSSTTTLLTRKKSRSAGKSIMSATHIRSVRQAGRQTVRQAGSKFSC